MRSMRNGRRCCIAALSKRTACYDGIWPGTSSGIIRDFDHLERRDIKKPKVGIVGEILVKFSPLANNHVVELLEAEGAEAVMPDLMDFLLYCFYNSNFKAEHLGNEEVHCKAVQCRNRPVRVLQKDGQKRAGCQQTFYTAV